MSISWMFYRPCASWIQRHFEYFSVSFGLVDLTKVFRSIECIEKRCARIILSVNFPNVIEYYVPQSRLRATPRSFNYFKALLIFRPNVWNFYHQTITDIMLIQGKQQMDCLPYLLVSMAVIPSITNLFVIIVVFMCGIISILMSDCRPTYFQSKVQITCNVIMLMMYI